MEIIKDHGCVGKYQVKTLIWDAEDAKKVPGVLFPNRQVLDIRHYEEGIPKQGISLSADMLTALLVIISRMKEGKNEEKEIAKKGVHRNIEYTIFDIYGTLYEARGFNIVFSTTKFGENETKYDIRPWKKDLSEFSLGVSLSPEEFFGKFVEILISAVKDFNLKYPKLLDIEEEDVCEACFSELVYQLDKMALCFGDGNKENFKKFYEDTMHFIRNWGTGEAGYFAKRK